MRPLFGSEEKDALMRYMDGDGFLTEFQNTERFEKMICEYTGAKQCIVVNNGTVSLSLALLCLDIKPYDEVIVPNYTMVATPNSAKLIGATPIFVDVEEKTLCLDIEKTYDAITPRTKAIFLVSANGRYPKASLDEFHNLSEKTGIPIIEDAAQSLGSFYPSGKHVGCEFTIGSFSFSAPKIISTGQGGALVTNDENIAKKLRKLKDFGRESGGNDIHDTVGFNFKFTELQACVGIEQMKKLEERVERKKQIWQRYNFNLENCNSVTMFEHNLDYTSPWFIDIIAQNRDELSTYLKRANIGTRAMYPPLNEQKAYMLEGHYPISKSIGQNGLWLPSQVQLTDDQIDYICDTIIQFYKI